ncbi:MAG TPA: ABC transporter substrate-binding protein [Phycisphaerae bacterium]|nr:ABC transporter substrate-binding protein [Phycisphaerae bacterium]
MKFWTPILCIAVSISAISGIAIAGKYNEAPELAALVKAGKLPPVEQRLPAEPFVAHWSAKDGRTGKYGGILRLAVWDPEMTVPLGNSTSLIQAKHSYTVGLYPNLAKSYEMKDQGREWIIHLREHLKWSDGHPYTVDDIIFWYEDYQLNEEVTPTVEPRMFSGGEIIKFEKLDDYTLRIRAKQPYLLETNRSLLMLATHFPKHYLKQFHPRYIGDTKANELARKSGFVSWDRLFFEKADSHENINPDKPSLEPWILTQASPNNPVIFKRNPYYWAVDEAGNQLPYINEVRYAITGGPEIAKLKALAGEVDFATIEDIVSYSIFKKAEKRDKKIKVFRWASTAVNALQVEFNLTHQDPVMRKIFLDKRFRFAVSHAINREMISELVWLGLAEPWQVAPYETSRFYNERLAHTALKYDPVKARKLLDEMGLEKKDADGYRLRPDGQKLQIDFITIALESIPEISEIVVGNLKDIGLNTKFRILDLGFLSERKEGNNFDATFIWQSWGTAEGVYLAGGANHLVSVDLHNFWSPEWTTWYQSGGKKGVKPVPDMIRALEAFDKARSTLDPKEQEKWFKVVTDIAADNLWTIGTTKFPGMIKVINPRLRNVPTAFLPWHRGDWGRPDLWFYEN